MKILVYSFLIIRAMFLWISNMGVTEPVGKYIEVGVLFGDSQIILVDESPTLF